MMRGLDSEGAQTSTPALSPREAEIVGLAILGHTNEGIANELGLDAVTSPTRSSPITGVDEWLRYASEALRVAFGRIFGFGRLARASNVGASLPRLAILIGPSGVV